MQNLNQKKSEHDEGISKLSTEAAGILSRVNTHRVLDTFKEKDPPEIVMWIVESIAIVIGEHDCSGTALDWKSGHLFREDASLISRLSDAAPRFANWDRAVMKRVWNVDEIECIDIVDLAKWFLLRKRIYEKQASFQPFLQELQNLEPELEKERIMIQRVRNKVDEAEDLVKTSEEQVRNCIDGVERLNKTIADLKDLHGKFEHVLGSLKRRVSKWSSQMDKENGTFYTLLGEWILGSSYRAFLMRMPTSMYPI